MEPDYSKRELDHMFKELKEAIERIDSRGDLILEQTTKHNGRMTRVERYLLVVACVVATLLVTNGSQIIQVFKILI